MAATIGHMDLFDVQSVAGRECVCRGWGWESLHGRGLGDLELAMFDRTCTTVNWIRHRGGLGEGRLFIGLWNMLKEANTQKSP